MSLIIHEAIGAEGRIEILGLRAVIGITSWWKLTRRGAFPSGEPRWKLRAVFSYLKEGLLNDEDLNKRIVIKYGKDAWLVCEPVSEPRWDGNRLEIEEVRLWPNE